MIRRLLPATLILLASTAAVGATARCVRWGKGHGGSPANVAATDLSACKVLTRASSGPSVTLVVEKRNRIQARVAGAAELETACAR